MASGPLETIAINKRIFQVDGEIDAALAFDGYMNEVKPNGQVGSFRMIKSRKVGRLNGIPITIDDDRDDEAFIQTTMDSKDFVEIEAIDVNNNVWSGFGQIVEDPETSKKEGVKEINVAGKIEKQ